MILKEGGKGLEVLMINEKRPNSQTFPMFGKMSGVKRGIERRNLSIFLFYLHGGV